MKNISILMATYNGEQFVAEQIGSIVNQTNDDWHLIIRDDGSSDATPNILFKVVEKHSKKITVINDDGANLGVTNNFSQLLKIPSNDYIMFADQDDIWLENKIEVTFWKMQETEKRYGSSTPILIHTDLKVVTDNLEVVAGSLWKYQLLDPNIITLHRLLIQNHITGCTVMINKALKDKSLPIPDGVIMHDWWIALVASCFGVIDYVPQATMLYRQHGENMEGAKEWNLFRETKSLVLGFLHVGFRKKMGKAVLLRTQKQAGIFLERYNGLLATDVKKMVVVYANLDSMSYVMKRLYFLKYRFFQKGFWRNVALFFKI